MVIKLKVTLTLHYIVKLDNKIINIFEHMCTNMCISIWVKKYQLVYKIQNLNTFNDKYT